MLTTTTATGSPGPSSTTTWAKGGIMPTISTGSTKSASHRTSATIIALIIRKWIHNFSSSLSPPVMPARLYRKLWPYLLSPNRLLRNIRFSIEQVVMLIYPRSTCQGNAIDPYSDWHPGDPEPQWQPICGGQGFSGKQAPATTQCPELQGVGGTPDTAAAFGESDKGHAIVAQVESGRKRGAWSQEIEISMVWAWRGCVEVKKTRIWHFTCGSSDGLCTLMDTI